MVAPDISKKIDLLASCVIHLSVSRAGPFLSQVLLGFRTSASFQGGEAQIHVGMQTLILEDSTGREWIPFFGRCVLPCYL